jgi:hypothetical protein
MRSVVAVAVFSSALAVLACSSKSSFIGVPGDGGAPAPGQSSLPLVDADDLGGKCSGFGTSIGDTAAFASDSCPAGICLVDAREGLELYCSADCTKVRCPDGWLCETTSVGSKRACFKDPNAPAKGEPDAATPASWLDEKLPAYRAGRSAAGTASIRDYADPTKTNRDLVILVIGGLWDSAGREFLSDPINRDAPRVAWISVLVEGPTPNVPAKATDFSQWHKAYPGIDMVLDPGLATLKPAMKNPLEALPTFVALDAATLEYIGEEMGWATILETVETWRSLANN